MRAKKLTDERVFILEAERELPVEEQTRFFIRGLSFDTQMALQSRMSPKMRLPGSALQGKKGAFEKAMKDADIEMDIAGGSAGMQFEILKEGLVRVENFLGEDGSQVETYPGDGSDDKKKRWFADWLPGSVRRELANAITEDSMLSEDEGKN